jgi:hypothetical protein
MKIIWSNEAETSVNKILYYWNTRNDSSTYSSKILNAIKELTKELSENPTFLANYIEEIGLYKNLL